MKKEFLIERQGKQFVLYAGLLDMAHTKGLVSIVTDLIQIPTGDTDWTAIFKATVTLKDPVTQEIKIFTGYGDANPKNVTPMMLTCLLRMAETRSKSRALRDSVNIGVTAFEELDGGLGGEDSAADESAKLRITPTRSPKAVDRSTPETRRLEPTAIPAFKPGGLSQAQHTAITNICKGLPEGFRAADEISAIHFGGVLISDLTVAQAAKLIRLLNSRKKAV